MKNRQSVGTRAIQAVVKGRETEILHALGISWRGGAPHINCPYPAHDDQNPSWRWDEKKSKAFCTCIKGSHSIFDVVSAMRALDFDAAKIEVAQLLGREDLIQAAQGDPAAYQATDATSLLNAPADSRSDGLAIAYLAYRLGVTVDEVPRPSTPIAGLKALGYYDPPP